MTSQVSTHVLDATTGRPAVGVRVLLEHAGGGAPVATGTTDQDGRVPQLGPERLPQGTYRLTFEVGSWFSAAGTVAFYPEVTVAFSVTGPEHLHVPLLLSPFAYSTYRGS